VERCREISGCGAKERGQGENCAQLDDNAYFPEPILQVDLEECFAIRKCAVELTGRNSVSPSMAPSRIERR
jgi:hypothetical protein